MKRIMIVMMVCFMGIVSVANARPYVTVGGGYGQNLNIEKVPDTLQFPDGFNSQLGFNARVGVEILPILAVEGEYSYLPGFKTQENGVYGNGTVWHSNYISDLETISANLKFKYPMRIKSMKFAPYLTVGIGQMRTKDWMDYSKTTVLGMSYSDSKESRTETTSYKLGGGIDFTLYKNLYFFGEYAYWQYHNGHYFRCDYEYHYLVITSGIGYKF